MRSSNRDWQPRTGRLEEADLRLMHSGDYASTAAGSAVEEKLWTLCRISQLIFAERDLGALLDVVAREATRLLEAERASIFLLDREKGELWSQVALGCEPMRFDAGLGIVGAVLRTGQMLNIADASQDPRFYQAPDRRNNFQTRNLLAVPLKNYADELTGVFEVINRKSGPFGVQEEQLLQALSAHAGIAIETAQLLHSLRRNRDQLAHENLRLRQAARGQPAAGLCWGRAKRFNR